MSRLALIPPTLPTACLACRGTGRHAKSDRPCFTCQGRPPKPARALPCKIMLTATPRSNGRQLRVRCECMSQAATSPVDPRTPFDHLADVYSIDAAVAAFREHTREDRP